MVTDGKSGNFEENGKVVTDRAGILKKMGRWLQTEKVGLLRKMGRWLLTETTNRKKREQE